MKDPNIVIVNVRAKRIEHCTFEELKKEGPILEDENGIKYKQIIDDPKPTKEVKLNSAQRRKNGTKKKIS